MTLEQGLRLISVELGNRNMLRKHTTALLAGSCLMATPALAQDEAPTFFDGEFSANVAITTDYTFRGVSQTFGDPAIQGGFDWASDLLYVGVWGSTVDFGEGFTDPFTGESVTDASAELDFYFGVTPSIGDLGLDFGFIYYFYPGAVQDEDDIIVPDTLSVEQQLIADELGVAAGDVLLDNPDQNYIELHAGGSYPVGPAEVGFNLTYSPDYYFETGDVLIPDVSLSFPLGSAVPFAGSDISFAFSGNVSYLEFLDDLVPDGGGFGESYGTYGLGVTATWFGIDLDARWIDSFAESGNFGSTGVFTISKSF